MLTNDRIRASEDLDPCDGARLALPRPPQDRSGAVAPTAGRRSVLANLKLEAIIFLLLLATLAAVRGQDTILRRTLVITPDQIAASQIRAYGDGESHGRTTVDQHGPLDWVCHLRAGYEYPYCGYEIQLNPKHRTKGLDLSQFSAMALDFSYRGPTEFLKVYLRDHDPHYSTVEMMDSAKYNKAEFLPMGNPEHIELKLSDFSVADWWVTKFKVRPEYSHPQFDNIIAIDIQPGTGARPGDHRFKVNRITFTGTILTPARFYLLILACWVVLITAFLVFRVATLKREFARSQRIQELESSQLELAKTTAETASKAKSDFLAHMSHELRTPLNAILGYAQLLTREKLDARQSTAARTIHQSGTHLLTLIGDVLDLAKIESGKLELYPVPFDLPACLAGVVDMIRVRAEEKGLDFRARIAPDIPDFVAADEKRLRQVLINLLGNAVKFTSIGEVSFEVSVLAADAETVHLRFEVRDTGIGIPEDRLATIFLPFEQLGDYERRASGTGLGLSISRQLVELMDSRIQVESCEAQGARFWLDVEFALATRVLPVPQTADATLVVRAEDRRVLASPPADQIEILLKLAMAGNMRAISEQASHIGSLDEKYRPFAEKLQTLARNYQSPAILRLIEGCSQSREPERA